MAVDFDSSDDEFGFLFCEELPGFGGVFREVDDKKVAGDAQDAGYETFDLLGC